MEKDRNLWNMSPTVRHDKGSDKDTLCLGNQERSKHKYYYDTEHGVERLKILESLVVSLLNCPFFCRLFSRGLFYRLEVTLDYITSRPSSTFRPWHLWVSVTPDTFYSKLRDWVLLCVTTTIPDLKDCKWALHLPTDDTYSRCSVLRYLFTIPDCE